MAIEIIPKTEEKSPLWLNILFYFSVILLIIAVVGVFSLEYFQKASEKELKDKEAELEMAQTAEQKALKEKMAGYEKKINDFSFFLDLHQFNSKIFPLLEKNTHPKVAFSNFTFDSRENKLDLSCQTESFQTLGEQIFIFKKEKLIRSVNLVNASIGKEGKVTCSLTLSFDPQLFKPR